MVDARQDIRQMETGMVKSEGVAKHVKRWGVVGVIVFLMVLGYALGWHKYFTMSSLKKDL